MTNQNDAEVMASYIIGRRLQIPGRPIDPEHVEAILRHLEANPNTFDALKVENTPLGQLDFQDIMNYLSSTQKSISRVIVNRFNFLKNNAYFEALRSFLLSVDDLTELDLSFCSLNSSHYGYILNLVKKLPNQVVLNLSGCHFTPQDQEVMFKVLPKLKKIKDIILENSNITKNMAQSLVNQIKAPPRVSNFHKSIMQSDITKSAVDTKKRSKFGLDYSTITKDKAQPRILIRCECTRAFLPSEMFICTTCSKSLCTFCAKSCVSVSKCFNCSRIITYTPESRQKTTKDCKSCIECPVCRNSLTFVDSNSKYFACKFCLWSSIAFQSSDEKNDELASGMIKHTFILGKEHETYLTELFYNYKDMMGDKVKGNIKDLWDHHSRMSELEGTQLRLAAKKDSNLRKEPTYRSKIEANFKRANLIRDTLNSVIDSHSMNPIFLPFYRKASKLDKNQLINSFKMNAFNLNLFHRLPIKVYRKREDYYIVSKLMQAYVMKSCRQCSKTLVNYEMSGSNVVPVTTSFLYEMNPSYFFRDVKLVSFENRTYRCVIRINNHTGYQYNVELKCKAGCRFSGGKDVIKHIFEFNKNVISINALKADRNAFINETALDVELEFDVDPAADRVLLELTQTKVMNLKTTITITDDLLVDFGPPQKFFELFE